MFERFTESARRAVSLSQEEAQKHDSILPEHLLLGLLVEHEGVAAQVLYSLDINLEMVRAKMPAKSDSPGSSTKPFTPETKRVLEYSLREALQLGHNYIGTEHILLGLLRVEQSLAFLADLGLEGPVVRQAVLDKVKIAAKETMRTLRQASRDPEYGLLVSVCLSCGAVVSDRDKHTRWHKLVT